MLRTIGFGVATSVAISTSLFGQDLSGLTEYSDPNGYFDMHFPEGWAKNEYDGDPRGKVKFFPNGVRGVSILVIAKKTNLNSLDGLLADSRGSRLRIESKYKSRKASGREVIVDWNGQKVVLGEISMVGFQQKSVSFLFGDQEFNISYAAPPNVFGRYEDIADRVASSIIAKKVSSGSSADEQTAQSKFRLAEIAMQDTNLRWAIIYVKEGLELNPAHEGLLKLAEQLGL